VRGINGESGVTAAGNDVGQKARLRTCRLQFGTWRFPRLLCQQKGQNSILQRKQPLPAGTYMIAETVRLLKS